MVEPKKISYAPIEEEELLIAESISFHGGGRTDALSRGLRAGHREIEVLKSHYSEGKKPAAAKGKSTAARKR